jgi:D-3-phosphoglycerate dehydrogenase
VAYATEKKLPVLNTPGVNHTTVAEHTFGLLLGITKKIIENAIEVSAGKWIAGWKKPVGHEILGSTMGIIGLGRIGKEVATRAKAFGMSVIAYDPYFDEAFAAEHGVTRCATMDEVLLGANVVSLHCFLDENTRGMINAEKIAEMKDGVIVLNCARGELVETDGHPLFTAPNCVITSHIASRTYESVERQAMRATHNLINYLKGDPDFIQANKF